MFLLTVIQDSGAYDAGYKVGYMLAKAMPIIVLVIIGFVLYKIFNKKSKK